MDPAFEQHTAGHQEQWGSYAPPHRIPKPSACMFPDLYILYTLGQFFTLLVNFLFFYITPENPEGVISSEIRSEKRFRLTNNHRYPTIIVLSRYPTIITDTIKGYANLRTHEKIIKVQRQRQSES